MMMQSFSYHDNDYDKNNDDFHNVLTRFKLLEAIDTSDSGIGRQSQRSKKSNRCFLVQHNNGKADYEC